MYMCEENIDEKYQISMFICDFYQIAERYRYTRKNEKRREKIR